MGLGEEANFPLITRYMLCGTIFVPTSSSLRELYMIVDRSWCNVWPSGFPPQEGYPRRVSTCHLLPPKAIYPSRVTPMNTLILWIHYRHAYSGGNERMKSWCGLYDLKTSDSD